ncbi:hypothetical protein F7725_012301 [Dissostichus mawsoni]|uniref:Uncharacterized protein n=1 Tax=Dissostichus mawsoni TaxID=36200 RepID=A0A7J5YP52_DISMA|nr:hypothetical protein F7725_012301 [Dissostichus mawsoni]
MCLRGLLLVSGLFLSSWALTPEECKPLVTPFSLAPPWTTLQVQKTKMHGRSYILAGYNDNDVFKAILKTLESSWMNVTDSPSGVFMSQFNKLVNSTVKHFDLVLKNLNIPSENREEISLRALYLMGREATLKDSDLEEFKKQASCLGFSGEPQYIYNPKNGFCTEEESIKM